MTLSTPNWKCSGAYSDVGGLRAIAAYPSLDWTKGDEITCG